MTPILVDSNVLLDLLGDDPKWGAWSTNAIASAADEAELVINVVIYAEVSIRYQQVEDLDAVLRQETFHRDDLPYPAAFLAGKAHTAYRLRGGTRTSPLPDFLIGAHAAVAGYRLLTRDATRYRTYFPKVELIAP
jgi:predicted nucleic acid-binding protein